ncbi:NHL repeat-containing protein [Dinghuibacter silviterrae]|uniref:Streptogramin lyase n=1 Tax=Dinghuibacter silviterrae TaxID=1539049 RepID=A0A4R8DIQ8_9BACT|nr:NHL repeat-containing protein [Dinghuibacter silviterrae]TDW97633.1 streptogramin lyase [Dinghuibacter silviterrae]
MTRKTLPLVLGITATAIFFSCKQEKLDALKLKYATNDASAYSAASSYTVSTFAGSGAVGAVDGIGTAASFNQPIGIAIDGSGNIYIADLTNNKIRKITQDGVVTTFAGSGQPGWQDGTGTTAVFHNPTGVAIDATGNLYVADTRNNMIRKITPVGVVTTFAGSGAAASVDGTGRAASFNSPIWVTVDGNDNIYVTEMGTCKLRKITSQGVVTTFAGRDTSGSSDGIGTAASFARPEGMCTDTNGNIYLADCINEKIRKITPAALVTTLAGSGAIGSSDGAGTVASFRDPMDAAIDRLGYIYVCDYVNNTIRRISPSDSVTTIAGIVGKRGSADGPGSSATFFLPRGVAVDHNGNVYVADTYNNKIRKLTPNN